MNGVVRQRKPYRIRDHKLNALWHLLLDGEFLHTKPHLDGKTTLNPLKVNCPRCKQKMKELGL